MKNEFESKQGEEIPIENLSDEFKKDNDSVFAELENEYSEKEEVSSYESASTTVQNESDGNDCEQDTSNSEPVSEHLTGAIAVNIFDVVMSRLLSFGLNRSGYDVSYKDFKLDAAEKKSLEKPIDLVLKKYGFGELSPETQLIVILIAIYGAKFGVATERSSERKSKKVPRGTVEKEVSEGVNYYDLPAPYGRFSNGKPKKGTK